MTPRGPASGSFLELSLSAPDIGASLEFYARLGFSEAPVGEAWPHPYAVLADGRVSIGLHGAADFSPSVTFVRPRLLESLDRLEALGVEFEFRRLGADAFNELGWFDPAGNLLRLVEARTFSPVPRSAARPTLCGYFVEIGLPAPHRDLTKEHWEAIGFVGIDELDAPLPHVACTSDSIDVGLYDPVHVPAPALLFEVDDLKHTLERLARAGIAAAGRVPEPLRRHHAAVLTAPEGTRILLAQ